MVLGGDGTVGGVMDYIRDELQDGNTLSNYKVPVALLPLGTGNDFSMNLASKGCLLTLFA